MKKIIVLIALLSATSGYAQKYVDDAVEHIDNRIIPTVVAGKNYYKIDTTVYELRYQVAVGNTTFNIMTSKYQFSVQNANNTKIDGPVYYKDGRKVDIINDPVYDAAKAKMISGTFEEAFAATFAPEDLSVLARPLKEASMFIGYIISPAGETLEVYFLMGSDILPELLSIAPFKFAEFERNLKKHVKWTVNAYGQQLQYLDMLQFVRFDKLKIVREFDEPHRPEL